MLTHTLALSRGTVNACPRSLSHSLSHVVLSHYYRLTLYSLVSPPRLLSLTPRAATQSSTDDIALQIMYKAKGISNGEASAGGVAGEGKEGDNASGPLLEHEVSPTTRYNAIDFEQGNFVQGSFEPDSAGTCVFVFDNSYSRMRSKALSYNVEVVSGDAMDAATTASADAHSALHRRRKLGLDDRDADVGSIMGGVGLASGRDRRESDMSEDGQSASVFGGWLGRAAATPLRAAASAATILPGVGSFISSKMPGAVGAAGTPGTPGMGSGISDQMGERIGTLEDDLALMEVRRSGLLAELQVMQSDLTNEKNERRRTDAECDGLRNDNTRLEELVEELRAAQASEGKDARRMDQMEDEHRAWQIKQSNLEQTIALGVEQDLERLRDMDGMTDVISTVRRELSEANDRVQVLTNRAHSTDVEIAQLHEQRRVLATDVRRQTSLQAEAEDTWQRQSETYMAREAKAEAQIGKLKAQKKILVAELRKVAKVAKVQADTAAANKEANEAAAAEAAITVGLLGEVTRACECETCDKPPCNACINAESGGAGNGGGMVASGDDDVARLAATAAATAVAAAEGWVGGGGEEEEADGDGGEEHGLRVRGWT